MTVKDFAAYEKVLAGGHYGHLVAKPGDVLPIPGMKVEVISADGQLIGHALPGGGEANPYCKASEVRPPDQTENARSLGVLVTFGGLKILDLGDLTWDKEMQLMCPRTVWERSTSWWFLIMGGTRARVRLWWMRSEPG